MFRERNVVFENADALGERNAMFRECNAVFEGMRRGIYGARRGTPRRYKRLSAAS